MFQPRLSLIPQPDGSFTLLVQALVPNSCYIAGAITKRKEGIQIPEIQAYNFEIIHHEDICTQSVHYVSATLAGLRAGQGHDSVLVFSMVDGKDVGHAAVSFPQIEALKAVPSKPVPGCLIIPDSVSAVVHSGLVGPAELSVSCLVSTPTPGYKAKLEKASPQGFNPSILLLNLVVTPPDQPEIQIPATTPAHYEDSPYKGHYSDVTILNGSQSVTVPVIVIFSAFEASHKYDFSTRGVGA
ncbi:hypothetical protein [Rhodopseudomonas palustris]|uniref:Uncharacterized protein n=1 Tax=Rhodopseudomonas palustris (strain BisB18) TaxID=316056 RepID=Q213Z2_RHOPB